VLTSSKKADVGPCGTAGLSGIQYEDGQQDGRSALFALFPFSLCASKKHATYRVNDVLSSNLTVPACSIPDCPSEDPNLTDVACPSDTRPLSLRFLPVGDLDRSDRVRSRLPS
jgi:hypothetical protein